MTPYERLLKIIDKYKDEPLPNGNKLTPDELQKYVLFRITGMLQHDYCLMRYKFEGKTYSHIAYWKLVLEEANKYYKING